MAEKLTYSEKLKHPKWQEKRLRVMERDCFKCCRCGSDEKTLNVHHRLYIKRREVWQYKIEDLETLCVDCHYKEHFGKDIAPPKDWDGLIEIRPTDNQKNVLHLQEKLKQIDDFEAQCEILKEIKLLQNG